MTGSNKKVPIISTVIRYLCSFACIALGIYFCIAQTNGYIGATMAFTSAILVSPLLDIILSSLNLNFNLSYRAILVIIAVAVDIATVNMKYWLFINVGVILLFFILFIVLSNMNSKKQVVQPRPKEFKKEVKTVAEVEKPRNQKPKKANRFKDLFSVDYEDEDEEEIAQPRTATVSKAESMPVVEQKIEKVVPQPKPMSEPRVETLAAQQKPMVENEPKLRSINEEARVQPVAKEVKKDVLDTPTSMVVYAMQHGYEQSAEPETMKACFACILAAIKPDEKVLICFMGKNGGVTTTNQDDYYGYAITTKRLVLGKMSKPAPIIQALPLTKIDKVTVSKGLAEGILHIHTASGVLNIGMDNNTCQKIGMRVQRFIDEIARLKAKLAQEKRK